jgi:succinylarginine dihydrolase
MNVYEMNLDGLVGPSHHYAGLSFGNMASVSHALNRSNPAKAALQGLEKMRFLHHMGIKQAVLPPHPRPNLKLLHALGFKGTPTQQVQAAHQAAPSLLSTAYSASSMWTANAATGTPSCGRPTQRPLLQALTLKIIRFISHPRI